MKGSILPAVIVLATVIILATVVILAAVIVDPLCLYCYLYRPSAN